MVLKKLIVFALACSFLVVNVTVAQKSKHTFKLGTNDFILDKEPFQIISGELYPARIPAEYWLHRILMVKAMGCNTVTADVFWNYQESEEDVFDFSTTNHNLARFIQLVQQEEMWLILKPGPYVNGDWELGGIPPYLLRVPDIKLRSMDPRYMAAVDRYIKRLAEEIKPFLVTNGGPVLMLQIEDEYGSFGNDKAYLNKIKQLWSDNGIDIPTFTSEKPETGMLEAGTVSGSAVGLCPGSSIEEFSLAEKVNPGVPVFSSATYLGWNTHWGEGWAKTDSAKLISALKFLMDNKKSFNLHVVHGGTNLGFTAGADGNGYEPVTTSYDYDAPVNEQGVATGKYYAIRNLLEDYLPKGKKLPPIPKPVDAIDIPLIFPAFFTSIWDNLPQPIISEKPGSFETYNQDYGFILYKTELPAGEAGKLIVTGLHDYATVFVNGSYVGTISRKEGDDAIDIPEIKTSNTVLEILVEGMGRISSGKDLQDRKGITDNVVLNGNELKNWQIYKLPIDKKFIYELRSSGKTKRKPGVIFKGNVSLVITGDTYFDMGNYSKGMVWVNGYNLGRYWNIGPQNRLFCPGMYLRKGMNEILIFDMHEVDPKPIAGFSKIE